MIDRDRLKSLLGYDPITGQFSWNGPMRGVKPGKPVGHRATHGYVTIRLDRRPYYAHRLAWLYMTGEWPPEQIDHINGVGTDNRFANLRLASRAENNVNRPRRRDNSSGFKGVFRARSGRFTAQIRVDGWPVHIGTFDTAEEAFAARNREAERIYGTYYRPA